MCILVSAVFGAIRAYLINKNNSSLNFPILQKLDMIFLNPIALRMAKTLGSFGHSECNWINCFLFAAQSQCEKRKDAMYTDFLTKAREATMKRLSVRFENSYCMLQSSLFVPVVLAILGYETISGTLPQCVLCFACTFTILSVDKMDATADVQLHCSLQPPLIYHFFSSSEHSGCRYSGLLDQKNSSYVASGRQTLDFL